MRGGAQAHLLECDDGQCYVVKFRNNPQHRRILVNEWLASSVLAHLKISTPEITRVNVTGEFLAGEPEVYIEGRSRTVVGVGQHFGSRYPCPPSRTTVYDFLPDALMDRLANRREFLGVLVFDKWTGNVDARQAIFRRMGPPETGGDFRGRGMWWASMIDQGGVFGGPDWKFLDSPIQGLYFRRSVYQDIRSLDDFQPWLDRAMALPRSVLAEAHTGIPPEWVAEDEQALEVLIERLFLRRERLPDLLEESLRILKNPSWKCGKRVFHRSFREIPQPTTFRI